MKHLPKLFAVLAIVLTIIMCIVVAYNYGTLVWGGQYGGYSAPPETAFFLAIPYLIGIAVCVILALFFKKKHNP